MPRPCKCRRVCAAPSCGRFGPMEGVKPRKIITMTLDEFEAIRLIDLEGLTQEECAGRMNVARTTAQSIYGSARTKLAQCLVHGRELKIEGGDVVICDGSNDSCSCPHCCKHRRRGE